MSESSLKIDYELIIGREKKWYNTIEIIMLKYQILYIDEDEEKLNVSKKLKFLRTWHAIKKRNRPTK